MSVEAETMKVHVMKVEDASSLVQSQLNSGLSCRKKEECKGRSP